MTRSFDESLMTDALAQANIPTLLMVLVQMTGDLRWLEAPYRPRRARGMDDNTTGGLPETIQQEIRDAARDAILAWNAGRPLAIPMPPKDLRLRMLSAAVGERVPETYDSLIEIDLPGSANLDVEPIRVPEGFWVLVIGAGMSGLCSAYNLKLAGVPFRVVEKSTQIGGVWRDNHYPGAGVDTPNHLYSFSFAPYDWSMYFALRDELKRYLDHVADLFDLRRSIAFETTVESLAWDETSQRWRVEIVKGAGERETLTPNAVISAVGIFNPIKFPQIEGLGRFEGRSFHTGAWPDDVDLAGKRVAVIGNGASSMQTCPAIQNQVASLTIFQRSLHWAAPNEQFLKPIPEALRFLLREVPLYRAWYRLRLGWAFGDRIHGALQKDPEWPHAERSLNRVNDAHRQFFTDYIVSELGDRQDLLDRVLPAYPPFGKRMLMDNGWYRMLRNPRVELVSNPIARIEADRVVTEDGREFAVDVLVIATGFDVLRFLTSYEARGRSGRTLREVWNDDDAKAYLGTVIPDFPNFFCLYGPNLQAGHGGSLIFMVEMQIRYVLDILRKLAEADGGAVECRRDVYDAYNADVDRAHANMVWTHPGMTTYYRNSRGRIVVNSPWLNSLFFERTRSANSDDFVFDPRR